LSFNTGSQSKLIDDSFKPAIEEKAKEKSTTPDAAAKPSAETPAQ